MPPTHVTWLTEDMMEIMYDPWYQIDTTEHFDYFTTTLTVGAGAVTQDTTFTCKIITDENGYEVLEATVHLHFYSEF